MFSDLLPAFRLITVMTVLTGLVYRRPSPRSRDSCFRVKRPDRS